MASIGVKISREDFAEFLGRPGKAANADRTKNFGVPIRDFVVEEQVGLFVKNRASSTFIHALHPPWRSSNEIHRHFAEIG